MDPKRPQLPDHPSNRAQGGSSRGTDNFSIPPGSFHGGPPPHGMMGYNHPRPPFFQGRFIFICKCYINELINF